MNHCAISIGLDIATALSVIGACAAYIIDMRKQRKKKIGEERQHERVINLSVLQEDLENHLKSIIDVGSVNDGETLSKEEKEELWKRMNMALYATKIYLYNKALPVAIKYADPDLIKMLENDILTYLDKSPNLVVPIELAKRLAFFDGSIMIKVRQLLFEESPEVSKNIVNDYLSKRFGVQMDNENIANKA